MRLFIVAFVLLACTENNIKALDAGRLFDEGTPPVMDAARDTAAGASGAQPNDAAWTP